MKIQTEFGGRMILETAIIKEKRRRYNDFGPSQWKHLFRLLGLVLAANKRIIPEEVDAYIDSLMELRPVIDPKIVLTRRMLREWLIINKDSLMADIESLEYDTVILNTVNHMRNFPYKLDVMTAMVKVAVADDNYSALRQMLIKKTILYWNIRP